MYPSILIVAISVATSVATSVAMSVVVKAVLLIVLIMACLAGGFFGGFFLFRMRFKKGLGLYEARVTALKAREEEMERMRASPRSSRMTESTSASEATIKMLREDLEQGSIDLSIARQEFDLELSVLREEIESLRSGDNNSGRYPVEIVDVEFESTDLPEKQGEVQDDEVLEATSDSARQQKEQVGSEEEVEEETEEVSQEEQEEKQPRRATEPVEETKSPGDWAESVISYLLGDLFSTPTGENEKSLVPEESETSEKELRAETVTETSSEFALETSSYPRFRSLVEFVSFEDLTNGNGNGNGFGNAVVSAPESINSKAEEAGLQVLLDLTDPQFRRLSAMGFASYEKIAELSSPEIRSLAEEFQISSERIEQIWISGAQLRLYEGN